MEFADIKSLNDIHDIINTNISNGNDDGESLYFEIKGSSGKIKINKDIKAKLSKEICAFANTYGGIICYHFGRDDKIEKFPDESLKTEFNSLETWLRDSLEPKLIGIDPKLIDNIFIINVPESKTTPHRTTIETKENPKDYYYRLSSISQRMPEIMISSMYRSQDYLNFSIDCSLSRLSKFQFNNPIRIKNNSRIAGTKPKVKLSYYSNLYISGLRVINIGMVNLITKPIITEAIPWDTENSIFSRIFSNYAYIETTSIFKEHILYPDSSIRINISNTPVFNVNDKKVANNKYITPKISLPIKELDIIVIKVECYFIESIGKSEYFLFQFRSLAEAKLIKRSSKVSKILSSIRKLNS